MRISEVRGVALVSVLLIVALVAALAWRMITQHQLAVAHTRHFLHGGQARHYALAGEEYARQALFADWEDEETRTVDTLLEEWANPQPDASRRAGEAGQGGAIRTWKGIHRSPGSRRHERGMSERGEEDRLGRRCHGHVARMSFAC